MQERARAWELQVRSEDAAGADAVVVEGPGEGDGCRGGGGPGHLPCEQQPSRLPLPMPSMFQQGTTPEQQFICIKPEGRSP